MCWDHEAALKEGRQLLAEVLKVSEANPRQSHTGVWKIGSNKRKHNKGRHPSLRGVYAPLFIYLVSHILSVTARGLEALNNASVRYECMKMNLQVLSFAKAGVVCFT